VGIESAGDFDATGNLPCGCVICEKCRAANALYAGRPNFLDLALIVADLQGVIAAWSMLPAAVRAAMTVLTAIV
jgi:hypothetical protein